MAGDDEVVKGIERAGSGASGGHANFNVVDELLQGSNLFNDQTARQNAANSLEQSNTLPKLAVDLFNNPGVYDAFKGDNGQLSRDKMEQASGTGKLGETAVSPSTRFVADALLQRWDKIDRDGVSGISMDELKQWAGTNGGAERAGQTDSSGGNGSDLKLAVMPNNTEAINSPGIVRDITNGASYEDRSPSGWKQIADGHAGNKVYENQDGTQVAKIGNLDDITAQAEALKQLRDNFGVSVPNFELHKDVREGKEVGVLIMDKVDFDRAVWANPAVAKEAQPIVDAMARDLRNAGFNTDFTGDNYGFKPGVADKIKNGQPLSPDDIVVIDPVTDRDRNRAQPDVQPQQPERHEGEQARNTNPNTPDWLQKDSWDRHVAQMPEMLRNLTDWSKLRELIVDNFVPKDGAQPASNSPSDGNSRPAGGDQTIRIDPIERVSGPGVGERPIEGSGESNLPPWMQKENWDKDVAQMPESLRNMTDWSKLRELMIGTFMNPTDGSDSTGSGAVRLGTGFPGREQTGARQTDSGQSDDQLTFPVEQVRLGTGFPGRSNETVLPTRPISERDIRLGAGFPGVNQETGDGQEERPVRTGSQSARIRFPENNQEEIPEQPATNRRGEQRPVEPGPMPDSENRQRPVRPGPMPGSENRVRPVEPGPMPGSENRVRPVEPGPMPGSENRVRPINPAWNLVKQQFDMTGMEDLMRMTPKELERTINQGVADSINKDGSQENARQWEHFRQSLIRAGILEGQNDQERPLVKRKVKSMDGPRIPHMF